jgi:hypothetical protein
MRRYITLGILVAASLVGCNEPTGGYEAASAISRDGFARNREAMRAAEGREIRLWGYVDHPNLYGDAGARRIVAQFWSGDGPHPATWRFDLKAESIPLLTKGPPERPPLFSVFPPLSCGPASSASPTRHDVRRRQPVGEREVRKWRVSGIS